MGLVLAAFVAGTVLTSVGCTPSATPAKTAPKATETKKDGGDKPPMDGEKKDDKKDDKKDGK
jgi:hypothetical protein